MIAGSELTLPLVLESWVQAWNGNADDARGNLRMALRIHPGLEHLRTRLGSGRRALSDAIREASSDTSGVRSKAQAGFIALQREDPEVAIAFLKQAMGATDIDDDPALRAQVALGLGRSYLDLAESSEAAHSVPDHFRRVREYLDEAETLGADATLARLQLEIASIDGDAPSDTYRRYAQEALVRFELVEAMEAYRVLFARGEGDTATRLPAARIAESFGEFAGAYILYQNVLATDPTNVEAQIGASRCGLEVAIRRDVFRRAYGDTRFDSEPRTALIVNGKVPPDGTPVVDFRRPEPWLQLADSYLRGGRVFTAYLKARAARAFAPEAPLPYIAIGKIAERANNPEVAEMAYEAARARGATETVPRVPGG
jgi:tetratricopeptide (TPR) repeat protein